MKTRIYNYVRGQSSQVTETYSDVGSSAFQLGEVRRAFTSVSIMHGVNELIENIDYVRENEDVTYTNKEGIEVYTALKITNSTYQSGALTITYSVLGSYTDANTMAKIITDPFTVTVGTGGDFTSINNALLDLTRLYPIYKSGGVRATIMLLENFIMDENVLVDGLDLSWITISGEDDETVIASTGVSFTARNGGFLPIINQLFDQGGTGTDGVRCDNNSRAIINSGCGVKNAGRWGIYAFRGSTINANGADASGAGVTGILANQASTIDADGADVSGAGTYGIYAFRGSTINADGADAWPIDRETVSNYISVIAGGIVNIRGATLENGTDIGQPNITPNQVSGNEGIIWQ